MNIIEKRDFIYNHLSKADEQIIDEMFEKLRAIFEREAVLKSKLSSRAKISEENIHHRKLFSKKDAEKRTGNFKK